MTDSKEILIVKTKLYKKLAISRGMGFCFVFGKTQLMYEWKLADDGFELSAQCLYLRL